jgi:hypothetical protein
MKIIYINFLVYLLHKGKRNKLLVLMFHLFTYQDVFEVPNLKVVLTYQKSHQNLFSIYFLTIYLFVLYVMIVLYMI